MRLILCFALLIFSSCASYTVLDHLGDKEKDAWVIRDSGGKTLYYCRANPDPQGTMARPVCIEPNYCHTQFAQGEWKSICE